MTQLREAQIGIVVAEQQTIFRTGSKKTVRFIGAFIYQIIDEYTDITIGTAQNKGFLFFEFQSGIDPCHKTLTCGFFIPGSTVDLPCTVKAFDIFIFQSGCKLRGDHTIVFNGISRAHDFYMFQTGNGLHEFFLDLIGHPCGHPLYIDLIGIKPFGFQKE